MWPLIAAGVTGALLAFRRTPSTRVQRLSLLGKSGQVYTAERFPELRMVIVRGPGVAAVFDITSEGLRFKEGSDVLRKEIVQ